MPAAWQFHPLCAADGTQFSLSVIPCILPRHILLLLMIMGRRPLIGLSDVTDVLFSPLGHP